MKQLKRITISILVFFIFLSTISIIKADTDQYQYLNNLDFNVKINSDGSMDVIETWDLNLEYTNTLFKTFKIDKTKFNSIKDLKVSVISKEGKAEPFIDANQYYYHVPTGEYYFLNRGNEYEVAWGTGYEYSKGNVKYKISYHVIDAITKYNDIAELYWQFVGSDFEIEAKRITGQIKLPEAAESKEEVKIWGHTPDLNGTINFVNNETIRFEVNNNKKRKMVEVRIAMPTDMILLSGREYNKDKLNSIIEEESKWANEANSKRIGKIVLVALICIGVFGVFIYFFIRNIKIIRTRKPLKPTVHYDYFRELPRKDATPLEALYLRYEMFSDIHPNFFGKIFSATILNLVLKKAVSIEKITNEKGKEDQKIEILVEDIESITTKKDEILIFNFIKDACEKSEDNASKQITMSKLKKYINNNSTKVISLKRKLDIYIKQFLKENDILDIVGIEAKNKHSAGCSLRSSYNFFCNDIFR